MIAKKVVSFVFMLKDAETFDARTAAAIHHQEEPAAREASED